MKLKNWPKEMQPREKALSQGFSALSDCELLAIVLSSGTKGVPVMQLAEQLLVSAGGLKNIMNLSLEEMMKLKGIKLAKACQLSACRELMRRSGAQRVSGMVIEKPDDICEWLKSEIGFNTQENVLAVFLNSKNQIISWQKLFVGSCDNVTFGNRELFQQALKVSASRILIAHNHPSGFTNPSRQDKIMTQQIKQAGEMMNIPLLDHVIVSSSGYFSFQENKLL